MSGFKSECRKFCPNIFNKSKCTNCFRQKEEHSSEALESNRSCRKVSKCGYLFVAPDWDFSVPLNRTKRWQRRWFVLYDDGELTYSVDEHPETVPQAVIDMNKVLEVSDSEDVTGHQYSVAITAPERVYFIKGTGREESRWWFDVLVMFPRSKGRHKRNATFPGGKATTMYTQTDSDDRDGSDIANEGDMVRTRHLSFQENAIDTWKVSRDFEDDIHCDEMLKPWKSEVATVEEEEVFPTRDSSPGSQFELSENGNEKHHDLPKCSESPPTQDKIRSESKVRTRRLAKKESRSVRNYRSRSENISAMIPADKGSSQKRNSAQSPYYLILSDVPKVKRYESLDCIQQVTASGLNMAKKQSSTKISDPDIPRRLLFDTSDVKREEKLKDIADSITRPQLKHRSYSYLQAIKSKALGSGIQPTREYDEEYRPTYDTVISSSTVRGDPDGCGLDTDSLCYNPTQELRVDLPAEEILSIKTGWLMKKDIQDWQKHWFVLRGTTLMYYKDPAAEDSGSLDGVIDLTVVSVIEEVDAARNYGFSLETLDNKKFILSAMTAGIRINWINALKRAAKVDEDKKLSQSLLNWGVSPLSSPQQQVSADEKDHGEPTSRLYCPSDEYRPLCESVPCRELNSGLKTVLPPSPPSNRTAMSKSGLSLHQVKGKARSRTIVQSGRRSLTSPPSSRIGSRDEFPMFTRDDEVYSEVCPEDLQNDLSNLDSWPTSYSFPNSVADLEHPVSSDSNFDAQVLAFRQSLREASDVIKEQASHIRSLRAQASEAQAETNSARSQLEKLLSEKKRLIAEVDTWRSKSEKFELQVNELSQLVSKKEVELGDKISHLQDLDTVRQDFENISGQYYVLKKKFEEDGYWEDKWRALDTKYREERGRWMKSEKQLTEENNLRLKMDSLEDENGCLRSQLKSDKSELMKLKDLVSEFKSVVDDKNNELNDQKAVISDLNLALDSVQTELKDVSDRLKRGIDENDLLTSRIRELEGRQSMGSRRSSSCSLNASRRQLSRLDSLSDLTNIDYNLDLDTIGLDRLIEEYQELRVRFEKAISEIRALKREIRETQSTLDTNEVHSIQLRQDLKASEEDFTSQIELMGSRVQDLAQKLVSAEKQVRQLKVKLSKYESKERRRSQSLVGQESFQLGSDVEKKVKDLETKLTALESEVGDVVTCDKASSKLSKMTKSLRRKSLDGSVHSESLQLLIRLNNLDSRVSQLQDMKPIQPGALGQDLFQKISIWSSVCPIVMEELKELLLCIERDGISDTQVSQLRQMVDLFSQNDISAPEASGHMDVVLRMQDLLQIKLRELTQKRETLVSEGRLDHDASLRLLAERLAYEYVLIGQMCQACLVGVGYPGYLERDVLCIHNRLRDLENKLSGQAVEKYESFVSRSARMLSQKMFLMGEVTAKLRPQSARLGFPTNASQELPKPVQDALEALSDRDTKLAKRYGSVRQEKLERLAILLAVETLQNDSFTEGVDRESSGNTLEEERLREAWYLAQEIVNQELVQSEISHVMIRFGQMFERELDRERLGTFFLNNEELERSDRQWHTAQDLLRREMERAAVDLTHLYREALEQVKTGERNSDNLSDNLEVNKCLEELADLVAHRAIVSSYLEVLKCNIDPSRVAVISSSRAIRPEISSLLPLLLSNSSYLSDQAQATGGNVVQNAMDQAELSYLFSKFTRECQGILSEQGLKLSEGVELRQLAQQSLRHTGSVCAEPPLAPRDPPEKDKTSPVKSSHSVKGRKLSDCEKRKSSKRSVESDTGCGRCEDMKKEISRLKLTMKTGDSPRQREKVKEEVTALKNKYDKEIISLKKIQEEQLTKLSQKHTSETGKLRQESESLKNRIKVLKDEYTGQIEELYKTFECVPQPSDTMMEESIRQKYQSEIEQLRGLCEKGLVAMENSHRRIIAELEEKHRRELEQLQIEKEQALAEETQATLAALDAMRKAHEAQVQREIAKFKDQYLKKMQSSQDLGALHKEHIEEMEEIKREILSLSEKYSKKCLECASLEQKLDTNNLELSNVKREMIDLVSRNQSLRQHIANESSALSEAPSDPTRKLRVRENELIEKNQEIAALRSQLKKVQNHEVSLRSLCHQLNHYLKTERQLREDDVSALRERLERIILTGSQSYTGNIDVLYVLLTVSGGHQHGTNLLDSDSNKLILSLSLHHCYQVSSYCFSDSLPALVMSHRQSFDNLDPRLRRSSDLPIRRSKDLSRSPSCPRLSSVTNFLVSTPMGTGTGPPLSPLSGMVASRKKVFEPIAAPVKR